MQIGDRDVVKSQQPSAARSMAAKPMLEVTAVGAIQLPDIEVMRGFGVKMDSYLALQLGSSTVKTKKAYGGGRNPNWQQVLHLELQPGTTDLYITVWKYSKISQHEEIARGSLSLPAWHQQGEQSWDQRVGLQPARLGRGSAWGGEVLLKLKYTTVEDAPSCTNGSMSGASLDGSYQSSSLPAPALHSNGEQPLSSAGASASLSRLMNKLQKPRKSRASSDTVPVPSQPMDIVGTATDGEAPVGQSPRQSSQFLQKALDKVLKRVGGKDKERSSAISEGGYATAEESDTVSRRSSIASLTEPPVVVQEVVSAAPVTSAVERHRIMPSTWQQTEQMPVLATHTSTSTQTDSPAMHASDCRHALSQPSRGPSREAPLLPCQSDASLSPLMSSLSNEPIAEETGPAMLAAQVPPSRPTRSSSEGSQAGEVHPAAAQHPARMASFPTPPSPFAAVQEQPLLAEPAQSDQSSAQPGEGTPETAASGVPANGGSASTGSASLGAPQLSAEPAPAAAQVGRVRLEHLDTAYRRRQRSTSLADARGSTSSEMDGHAAASSAPVPESDAMASGADTNVDMTYDTPHLPVVAGPSSPAVPFCPAPNRGFVEVQPLGSPFADQSFMGSIPTGRGPACDRSTTTNGTLHSLSSQHLRQTGLMPDEDLQAGIKTMPLRIPPLPDAISSPENGCSSEEENGAGSPCIYEAEAHIGPLALQPRLSAAPEDDEDEHAEVAAEEPPADRVMRKTLSRKSPGLPELLQGWNDYSDIIFCEEYGKKVLLGEGSFGEVYKASYLDCDIAVKKLNRINDAKSEEAFRRECAILKGCRHPHIVNFMGVSKDEEGRICLMTELMDTSLMSALLLPDDANKEYHYFKQGRHVLICVAKALIYLHKHDIVHLDVKSANVLLKRGDAKLADVGLSQMLSKSFANSCSGMGTFSWAATELLLGSHPVTTAADIFSFGVLLWEVCTLEQPHLRHMRDITEDEAPEQIRQLFSDCVREDPSSRPTAKQVLLVLMEN